LNGKAVPSYSPRLAAAGGLPWESSRQTPNPDVGCIRWNAAPGMSVICPAFRQGRAAPKPDLSVERFQPLERYFRVHPALKSAFHLPKRTPSHLTLADRRYNPCWVRRRRDHKAREDVYVHKNAITRPVKTFLATKTR